MTKRSLELTSALYDYLLGVSLREPDVLARLRAETAKLKNARMQVAPDQGQFMGLLVELIGARRALEVGTFTGYSALCVARALPADGQLIACDISEEWTAIARRYWSEAGVADRIDLRLAPAVDTLDALIAEGSEGSFDFAFIDADKEGYADYYERVLKLLRTGGVVLVDNVLWGGRVLDPAAEASDDTRAIQAFNARLHADERVSIAMIAVGDGLTLARKR